MEKRVSRMAEFGGDVALTAAPTVDAEEQGNTHFQGLNGCRIADEATDVRTEIKALDLDSHVTDLEIMGLTVVPPEKVGILDRLDELRETLLDVHERRYGRRPDWIGNKTHTESPTPFGSLMSFLCLEAPIFQDLVMNRTILAIATQQLGRNCVLSAFQAQLKPKGGKALDLHVDELIAPAPYAHHNDSINATVLLTDYTEENGPLCYVPGSHKYMRPPIGSEGLDQRVKVLARKGSLVVWPRSTWHGAYIGKAPGLRINLGLVYSRPNVRTLEDYRSEVTKEQLQRNPPRFSKLMGQHISYGWKHEGPVLDGSETLIGSTAFN